MAAIDDLKTAVANLNTSISNEIGAITNKLSSITTGGTSDADVEAVVTQLQTLQAKVDSETAAITGGTPPTSTSTSTPTPTAAPTS